MRFYFTNRLYLGKYSIFGVFLIKNAKKIQKVISNILDKEAVFKNGHWSSAVNFERRLADDGFITACPISHQYKFPDGITEADYEKKVMNNMYYLGLFEPLRIENPELYVDYIFQHPDFTPKTLSIL